RALGLLATSSTGPTAIAARFINQTSRTLNYMHVQVTGELWRQSNVPKKLSFYYFIDPTGIASFSTNATAFVPGLNVSFPTSDSAFGGLPIDGTIASYQTNLVLLNQVITNWPPGAALWLVWEMADPAGRSQGLAIDNLVFSASDQPLSGVGPQMAFGVSGDNLVISWPTLSSGYTYQIEYEDDLNASSWTALGTPLAGTGASLTITNSISQSDQRFYRLRILP